MEETLAMVGLTVVGFVATNIDNFVLLVAWQIAPESRAGSVFVGYALGMTSLISLCYIIALSAAFVPVEYLGFLGVAPLAFGMKKLWELWRRSEGISADSLPVEGTGTVVFSIAATQVGNGADTIVVFVPLLADTASDLDPLIAFCFAAAALMWFAASRFLAQKTRGLAFIGRYGDYIAPLVMIAVGLYILNNTTTDLLPGH